MEASSIEGAENTLERETTAGAVMMTAGKESVSVLPARRSSVPQLELHHYKAALYLLRYLKETRELGLEYHQANMAVEHSTSSYHYPAHDPVLEAAADASFADDPETYRSTGGFVVWFWGSPVDYECKRQPLVTMSTQRQPLVRGNPW